MFAFLLQLEQKQNQPSAVMQEHTVSVDSAARFNGIFWVCNSGKMKVP